VIRNPVCGRMASCHAGLNYPSSEGSGSATGGASPHAWGMAGVGRARQRVPNLGEVEGKGSLRARSGTGKQIRPVSLPVWPWRGAANEMSCEGSEGRGNGHRGGPRLSSVHCTAQQRRRASIASGIEEK